MLLVGAAAIGAFRTRKNSARGNDDNVTVGEFLLELTSEAVDLLDMALKGTSQVNLPLLNLVPLRKERYRNEDDDCLASMTDINL